MPNITSEEKKEIWSAIDKLRETVSHLGDNMVSQIAKVTETFNIQIAELNKFIYQNVKRDANGKPSIVTNGGFDWKSISAILTGVGLIVGVIFHVQNSSNMQINFLAANLSNKDVALEKEIDQMSSKYEFILNWIMLHEKEVSAKNAMQDTLLLTLDDRVRNNEAHTKELGHPYVQTERVNQLTNRMSDKTFSRFTGEQGKMLESADKVQIEMIKDLQNRINNLEQNEQ